MTDPVDDQVASLVEVLEEVLGAAVVAIYLYGSAVMGGLRHRSDLDLFVVTHRRTTDDEKRRLVEAIRPISRRTQRPSWWRPVELTIVVKSDVRPWRYPPRTDFQYGEWMQEEFDRGVVAPSPPDNPDMAVLISMVLLGARTVRGPTPKDVLEPVRRADLDRAMLDGIDGLLADLEADTSNVVLTLARIWATLETGSILPKDAAAEWALERLPEEHRPVLRRARAVYLGEDEDRWDDLGLRVATHAAHVVARIERSSTS